MWGGYVMAPWCNRIETDAGRGRGPDHRRWASTSSTARPSTARSTCVRGRSEAPGTFVVVGGGDGWPWRYEVRERVTVVGTDLRVALALTNLDDAPMPAGIGIHPWFLGPIEVAIRGESVYLRNRDTPPLPIAVAGTSDLRAVGAMADGLDATWARPDRARPSSCAGRELGIRAEMRVESPSICIVAASPAGAPAVAVEPETHAPQGLRRLLRGEPGALTMLAPGERLELVMELAFERS